MFHYLLRRVPLCSTIFTYFRLSSQLSNSFLDIPWLIRIIPVRGRLKEISNSTISIHTSHFWSLNGNITLCNSSRIVIYDAEKCRQSYIITFFIHICEYYVLIKLTSFEEISIPGERTPRKWPLGLFKFISSCFVGSKRVYFITYSETDCFLGVFRMQFLYCGIKPPLLWVCLLCVFLVLWQRWTPNPLCVFESLSEIKHNSETGILLWMKKSYFLMI